MINLIQEPAGNKVFRDRYKEQRIFEHLTNEHDIISEEDIRNVISDISLTLYSADTAVYHHNPDTSPATLSK